MEPKDKTAPRETGTPNATAWQKACGGSVVALPDGYRLGVTAKTRRDPMARYASQEFIPVIPERWLWTVEKWPGPVVIAQGEAETVPAAKAAAEAAWSRAPRETGTTPAEREARSSVRLDGETHCVDAPGPGDFAARLDAFAKEERTDARLAHMGYESTPSYGTARAAVLAEYERVAETLRLTRDGADFLVDAEEKRQEAEALLRVARSQRDTLEAALAAEHARAEEARAALREAAEGLDLAARWLHLSGAPHSATTTELAADRARRLAASPGADDGAEKEKA
jgi:hypothetical protein